MLRTSDLRWKAIWMQIIHKLCTNNTLSQPVRSSSETMPNKNSISYLKIDCPPLGAGPQPYSGPGRTCSSRGECPLSPAQPPSGGRGGWRPWRCGSSCPWSHADRLGCRSASTSTQHVNKARSGGSEQVVKLWGCENMRLLAITVNIWPMSNCGIVIMWDLWRWLQWWKWTYFHDNKMVKERNVRKKGISWTIQRMRSTRWSVVEGDVGVSLRSPQPLNWGPGSVVVKTIKINCQQCPLELLWHLENIKILADNMWVTASGMDSKITAGRGSLRSVTISTVVK